MWQMMSFFEVTVSTTTKPQEIQAFVCRLLYLNVGSEGSMIISFKNRGIVSEVNVFRPKLSILPLQESKFFTRTWVETLHNISQMVQGAGKFAIFFTTSKDILIGVRVCLASVCVWWCGTDNPTLTLRRFGGRAFYHKLFLDAHFVNFRLRAIIQVDFLGAFVLLQETL
jgi:hypothetical protein